MGLNRLIQLAVALTVLAASTGQLPKIILGIHIAQLHLLKRSQASTWGRPFLLPGE